MITVRSGRTATRRCHFQSNMYYMASLRILLYKDYLVNLYPANRIDRYLFIVHIL